MTTKPIYIALCVLALTARTYSENDPNEVRRKGKQAQAQQQQQHQFNKQTRHLENQQQRGLHQDNRFSRHLDNQQQHAVHQENKFNRHLENQDQHAFHEQNKLDRHLGNQEQRFARHEARRFEFQERPRVEAVRFRNENRIIGAERWQGERYAAFRNYRAVWHDRAWWVNHHHRIVFVFGAPYYWDAGWWYPAWGYEPSATFYFDGPIYAYNDLPPDQVVANVQSSLQEQGYYHGEVDGVLGPLTRAAIASYQEANGLYVTSAVDQPTLEALGMS